ncbi:MAG: alpha/beta hydrolase family protein, partial [Terriglobales bacterium]
TKFTEVPVKVGSAPWILDGTLSVPNGPGPFPAVVLVHGSGGHDRDETIDALKPFRDLAWGLSSNGIAVLRYEKRTLEYAKQMLPIIKQITVKEETIDDAAAAVKLLTNQPKIDAKHIYVLGHSLGGTLMPRIARQSPDAAGFIVLAGCTRPMEDLMLEQLKYAISLKSVHTADDAKEIAALTALIANVKDPNLTAEVPLSKLPGGMPGAYWLSLRGYNPAIVAKDIHKPFLILQGESDFQVSMKDFKGWKDALSSRGDVTFKSYPGLSHCFANAGTPPSPADYQTARNVSPQVITDITNWIKAQK